MTPNQTYYSKFVIGLSAVVIGPPDDHGFVPAYLTDDERGTYVSAIKPDEWVEVAPATIPDTVPKVMYVLLSGADADSWGADLYTTEENVQEALHTARNAWGYVPVLLGPVMFTA